jgi:GAF domain-containing protein
MAKFEVFIPPANSDGFNVTLRVDANNWMAALRIGLMKLGQQGANAQNILVDIQDDKSVHITESESGRVFRIRELSDAEAAEAKQKPGTAPLILDDRAITPKETPAAVMSQMTEPAISKPVFEPIPMGARTLPEQAVTIASQSDGPATVVSRPTPLPVPTPAPAADFKKTLPAHLKPAQPAAPKQQTVSKMRKSSIPTRAGTQELMPDKVIELDKPTRPVSGAIGRSKSAKDKKAELEDVLSDVFERVREVYAKNGPDNALYFLLDLALEKIPADSGSVFKADGASGDLTFWAARGPAAREILDSRLVVPAGTGIVGFCATEGVSVALSDVQKDPRFYSAVSAKVNYETRSVLCSPMMTHGRTFGAMQIINKKVGSAFAEYEVGLLSYIAHQGALYLNTLS